MTSVARTKREKDKRLHEIEMKIAVMEGRQKEFVRALEDPSATKPPGVRVHQSRSLRVVSRPCLSDGGMGSAIAAVVEP